MNLGVSQTFFLILAASTAALLTPSIRRFYFEMGWRWAYVLLLSLLLSLVLTPIFARIARRFGVIDAPNARKPHQEPTPLLGGAAVFAAFMVSILMNGVFSPKLIAILISAAVLFVIGIVDDYREVPAGIKLIGQIGCTGWLILHGIVLDVIPIRFGVAADALNILLTVIWIIGITNAMNFFDGMDGLAAGLSAIIALFLGIVAFTTHQPFLGWIAVAMMGACMGFLPYNFRFKGNARIFLGDAGSTVIGFVLACVAVYGEWADNDPIASIISPLLIFWLLIFDMIHITVDRIGGGKVRNFKEWIDYVGKDHLHHRLADVLGGKKKSVLFIWLLNICLGISAVILRNAYATEAVLMLIQACGIVILITILERRGRAIGGTLK